MLMKEFYSRLGAGRENNPLFRALRDLTHLDPNILKAWSLEDSNTWSPWDATGGPPEVARIPATI